MKFFNDLIVSTVLLVLVILFVTKLHAPGDPGGLDTVSTAANDRVPVAGMIAAYEPEEPAPTTRTPVVATRHVPWAEPAPSDSVRDIGDTVPQPLPANLSTPEPAPAKWVRVTGSNVNVRSAPTVDAPRVGSFDEGSRLVRLGEQDGWVQIRDPESGATGWMAGNYLRDVEEGSGVAAVDRPLSAPGI